MRTILVPGLHLERISLVKVPLPGPNSTTVFILSQSNPVKMALLAALELGITDALRKGFLIKFKRKRERSFHTLCAMGCASTTAAIPEGEVTSAYSVCPDVPIVEG